MKVLLVATNRERTPYPVTPLGVLYVAAAARAAGHEVDFLDMGLAASPEKALRNALKRDGYQAVAFGIRNLDNCWSFAPRAFFGGVRDLVEVVRERFDGPLILGGTGFSVSPNGWMKRLKPTCGVMGEGEGAFPEILSRLEAGKSLEGIDGVMTAPSNGDGARPRPSKGMGNMKDVLLPAHELCGYKKYVRRGGFAGVQTKRGCPFVCSYCIYPKLEGRGYRLRPPEAVVDEVESIHRKLDTHDFFFVDSVFNDPRGHALAICKELSRRRLPIRWTAFCNPVGFDEELARAMADSGCNGAEFGLDVATPRMLKAMGKPFDQEDIKRALKATAAAGLPFLTSMLYGGPGETWADVRESFDFLASCPPANAVFASYGIRVYEGTPLARTAVQEGLLSPDQDLFEPAYYLSPAMAENTTEKLDAIVRRRPEWTSPADWRKPIMTWAQKVMILFNVRPQWKYISGYGQHFRGTKPK